VESEVFLDTAYAIALASPRDQHHPRAMQMAVELERSRTRLITTQAILLEIGNALAKFKYRQAACQLLESLEQDPSVEVVWLSAELHRSAFALFSSRPDKEWSMTDCVSFAVMTALSENDARLGGEF
jgi:hypothetical protein